MVDQHDAASARRQEGTNPPGACDIFRARNHATSQISSIVSRYMRTMSR
jgi:hypothetical protein